MKTIAIAAAAAATLGLAACSPQASAPPAEAVAAAPAPTAQAEMEAAIARHVTAVKAADLAGVMADYADDAILVAPPGTAGVEPGTLVGKANVQKFFEWLSTPAVLPAAQSMVTTNEIVGPNTLLFRWTQFPGTPKEVKGYDIFVFRAGKIIFQTTAPMPS
jgi:hypothetical protein